MRVVLSLPPSPSHLYPVVPLASALAGAGHEVIVGTHPEMASEVLKVGLSVVPIGQRGFLDAVVRDDDELYERIIGAVGGPAGDRLGRPPSKYVVRTFARYFRDGAAVDDLVAFARAWRPDLVLWDPMSSGAPVAARACGAAHARVLWSVDDVGWTRERLAARPGPDPMAEAMTAVLDRHGVKFGEDLFVGRWTLDPYPARRRPRHDLRYIPVRSVPFTGSAVVPGWLRTPPERPRVCLSLGLSIRNFFGGEHTVGIRDIFAVAAELDIELVATLDAAQLGAAGAVPENVRLVDFLPLNLLLPTCAAIIHHGGSGTFAAAVANKLPQLVWAETGPYFDDIASYVQERGAGLAVDQAALSAGAVREQLSAILADPSFRAGAEELYRDMLAAPSPNDVVPLLEKLTADHRGAPG